MNSACLSSLVLFLCKYVFPAERYAAKDRFSLQFNRLLGCYHPKKLKIEGRQKTKLSERSNAPIFTIRVLGAIFDSPETPRAISYFSPRLIFQPGLKFVM